MLKNKFWLSFFNKSEYRQIKNQENIFKSANNFKKNYKIEIEQIQEKIYKKENLNFLHSGHAADIINVLPVIKELSKNLSEIYNINKKDIYQLALKHQNK